MDLDRASVQPPGHHFRVCLPNKCCLCCYDLNQDDKIVINPRDPTSGITRSYRWPWRATRNHHDLYSACNHPCPEHDTSVGYYIVCHTDCLGWLPKGYDLCALADMTGAPFLPTSTAKRELWLERAAAARVTLPSSSAVSSEIRAEIAQHLARTYAVALLGSIQVHRITSIAVNFSKPVRLHYAPYEGQHFITRIKNHDVSYAEAAVLPTSLFISETCHGIRNIFFSHDGAPPPHVQDEPDLWWKLFEVNRDAGAPLVKVDSDGYKVRGLIQDDRSTLDLIAWSHPQLALTKMRCTHWADRNWADEDNSTGLYMKSLSYNGDDVTGISVRCKPEPSDFHVHTAHDDDLSFYEETQELSVWVYIPLGKDERIAAIWGRCQSLLNVNYALAFFIVNKNAPDGAGPVRIAVAGAEWGTTLGHNLIDTVNLDWEPLDEPRGEPSTFYYDSYLYHMRRLMFTSPEPTPPDPGDPCPVRPLPPPPSMAGVYLAYFQYSEASLRGVTAFRRGWRAVEAEIVSGLLLRYEDDSVSSLGEVCLDLMDDDWTRVSGMEPLWLDVKVKSDVGPYIAEACVSSEEQKDCFRVDWNGTLEWWYDHEQCQLRHDDRVSAKLGVDKLIQDDMEVEFPSDSDEASDTDMGGLEHADTI